MIPRATVRQTKPMRGSRQWFASPRLLIAPAVLSLVTAAGWILYGRMRPNESRVPSADVATRAISHAAKASHVVDAPTFNKDIAPVLFARCAVCHRPGEAAPFSLLTYQDARKRAEQIADVTESRYMPPWKPEPGHASFIGNRRLTDQQIVMIREWADSGTPEGERSDLPPAPEFPEGWQLGEPDLVFQLPEPYTLPADGQDAFRNFVIPAPVPRTRYVRAVELRPGNARIAHHGLLKIDRTSTSRRLDAETPGSGYDGMTMVGAQDPDGHFIVWTPGTTPHAEPDDMAWRLDRNTDLVLQLHMQPTGKPETIQPAVGLYFTDTPPTRVATIVQLYSSDIDIPAGVSDYEIRDTFKLPVGVQVLGIFPHAHYIGKEMRAYAVLPDGTRRWLLHITDWDLNWQDDYRYAQPVHLPAGAEIVMHYFYDNSASNPRNPFSPPRRVVAGDESKDEMGSLTLRVLTSSDRDRLRLDEMIARVDLKKSLGRSSQPHYQLATSLQSQGRLEEAMQHYVFALKIDPKHAPSHCNLGVLLKVQGRITEAIKHYQKAIAADPEFGDAYTNLGNALASLGRHEDAIRHFHTALSIQPESAGARYNLGFHLQQIGRCSEALQHYGEVIRLQPDNVASHNHMAWIMATHSDPSVRNGAEAVRLAEIACRLSESKHHIPLDTLAAAHAESGDFDKALATAQLSLQRATSAGSHAAANNIRRRMELYRAKRPYRDIK